MLSPRVFRFLPVLLLCLTASAGELLNANSASEGELHALPILTDAQVSAIIANRPYATWGALNAELSASLDAEQLEQLYGSLYVPLKLNSASDADIKLIPGVGRKMAHEFEEYRPYKSIEQFRREIGKYVDEEEVARYEQYIILDL